MTIQYEIPQELDRCDAFFHHLWDRAQADPPCPYEEFIEIRDCFIRASKAGMDSDGMLTWAAATLSKESGDLELAQELYCQALHTGLEHGVTDPKKLAQLYSWAGSAKGLQVMRHKSDETVMRDALDHFHRALDLCESYAAPADPFRIQLYWALAEAHAYLNEMKEAEAFCRKILAVQESLPPNHPDRAETCIMLSQLCRSYVSKKEWQQQLHKAAEMLDQAACVPASQAWMFGLIACNAWSLPAQKRLEFCLKEKKLNPKRFCHNPAALAQWERMETKLQALCKQAESAKDA